MNGNTAFLRYSKWVLLTVFLVVAAGAVVRMTQSGMGCPDWPTCFGRWIPPVNESQLPPDFEKYLSRQDIDHSFNVFHTWTEYINRLLGAILGLLLVVQTIWSVKFWNTNRRIVWLCVATLLLTGFQAWLGKKVVDTNLAAAKITTHMLVALLIAAMSFTVIYLLKPGQLFYSKKISRITLITIFLLIIQIALGTRVRQQVDVISKAFKYSNREYWLERLNYMFDIHRSFSILVAVLGLYLYVSLKKLNRAAISISLIPLCIIGEITLGIIMAYFDIPAFAQPLHLLLSFILFIALYHIWLKAGFKAT